jgi:hypothetical protein
MLLNKFAVVFNGRIRNIFRGFSNIGNSFFERVQFDYYLFSIQVQFDHLFVDNKCNSTIPVVKSNILLYA